jgi:acyl-coenzyme A thioesterase PaaI-like protein
MHLLGKCPQLALPANALIYLVIPEVLSKLPRENAIRLSTTVISMSQKHHPLQALMTSHAGMRRMLNIWPPFLFSGISILEISKDFRHAKVRLKKRALTSNYVGTLFGGSLFAMTDPFYMVMILKNLGSDYIVWDKRSEIEYVSPGKATVFAEFNLLEADLDEIKREVEVSGKYLKWFEVDIKTADGTVVAIVKKQIYVRKK